ncbi:MAG: ATP-binding protein [Mariniphaga sp.]
MSFNIDLKELSIRESERVEWKENGDYINIVTSIGKTITAFANDISNKLKEIEGKVLQHCRDYLSPSITPIVHEIDNPENKSTRILVFLILASPDAHVYRDGERSHYNVRDCCFQKNH